MWECSFRSSVWSRWAPGDGRSLHVLAADRALAGLGMGGRRRPAMEPSGSSIGAGGSGAGGSDADDMRRREVASWHNGETLWRHAIACTTENGQAHANLAAILGRRGAFVEAIEQFKVAFPSQSSSADFLNNFSVTLRDAGRFDDAIHFGQLAVRQKPDDPLFHTNLALALMTKGFWLRRLRSIDRRWNCSRRIPYRDSTWHNSTRLGRPAEAAREFGIVLAAAPDFPNVRFYLANALTSSKAFDAAIEQYRAILEEVSGLGRHLAQPGRDLAALREAGRGDRRRADKAVELVPGNGDIHYHLAVVLRKQGKTADAAEQLQQAVALLAYNADYQRGAGGGPDADRPKCPSPCGLSSGREYFRRRRGIATRVGRGAACGGQDRRGDRSLSQAGGGPADRHRGAEFPGGRPVEEGKKGRGDSCLGGPFRIDPRDVRGAAQPGRILLATGHAAEGTAQLQRAVSLAP